MSIISDDEWNKHVESIADLHDQNPTEDTPTILGSSQDEATPTAQGHEADNRIAKKLEKLLEVGDVGIYRVMDGGYGVSLDFYDHSYYLAHPADTIPEAIDEMLDEWRVKAALKYPKYLKEAYLKRLDEGNDLITPGSSQDTVTPSRPGEHKKQELEGKI